MFVVFMGTGRREMSGPAMFNQKKYKVMEKIYIVSVTNDEVGYELSRILTAFRDKSDAEKFFNEQCEEILSSNKKLAYEKKTDNYFYVETDDRWYEVLLMENQLN